MVFDLSIVDAKGRYDVQSERACFATNDPALCVTQVFGGQEIFLHIGTARGEIERDPGFARVKDKLRFFDPFDVNCLEPRNVSLVVRFYLRKVHKSVRRNWPESLRSLAWLFLDRCDLTLHIEGLGRLSDQEKSAIGQTLRSDFRLRRLAILAA